MKYKICSLLLFVPIVAHAQCVETRNSRGDVISRSCVTHPLSAQDLDTLNELAAQSQKNNSQQTYEETQQADQASYNNTMAQWEDIEPRCSQAEATNRTINYKGKHLNAERCHNLRKIIDQIQKQAAQQGLDTH